MPDSASSQSLYCRIHECLRATEASDKADRTHTTFAEWRARVLEIDPAQSPSALDSPGRPARPALIDPRHLTRRSLHTEKGHAALIHAIAHIEFNAINLALDAVSRFREMPVAFIDDWLKIADEEASHFQLLREHLNTLGYDYGDFDAHNGLWEMAQQTAHDPLVRMALVPRVMEARGLDVTPGIMTRLAEAGDHRAVEILSIILHDEVGHVEIGTRWFHYLCDERDLPRQETFTRLFNQYTKGRIRLPLHREARKRAGFSEAELNYLEGRGW